MFGLVSRRRLEEAEFDALLLRHERDHWKALHKDLARRWCSVHDHNVRLRRELDALRNHGPLFGDVFNGSIL